jgi:hypothetical protein
MAEGQPAQVMRGPEYRVVFANQSRMRISNTEVALTFGFSDEVPGSGPFVQELVTLVLTPQHAKLVGVSLMETIRLYEEKFGPISTEVSAVPPLDQATLLAAIAAAKSKE